MAFPVTVHVRVPAGVNPLLPSTVAVKVSVCPTVRLLCDWVTVMCGFKLPTLTMTLFEVAAL